LGSVAGCSRIANRNHSHKFSLGFSEKFQNVILEVPRKSRLVGGASHEARRFQVFQLQGEEFPKLGKFSHLVLNLFMSPDSFVSLLLI
jgi:hypothetical protein